MQSKKSQIQIRRRHDAGFKASVIAACREPGASVAAVAQARGLNANLVRKWLVGRGLKRCGLEGPLPAGAPGAPAAAMLSEASPLMQFVPVQLPCPAPAQPTDRDDHDESIQIELTRAGASLTVRWPAAQATACAGWLGELAAVLTR